MCQPPHLGHSLPLSCEITSAHPKWAPLNALVGGRLSAEQVEGLWSCPSWAPSYMEDQESRPRCVTWAVEFESVSTAGPSLLGNNCGHQLTSKLQRSKRCTEEQRIVTVRALAVWQRRRRSGRTEGLPLPPPRGVVAGLCAAALIAFAVVFAAELPAELAGSFATLWQRTGSRSVRHVLSVGWSTSR